MHAGVYELWLNTILDGLAHFMNYAFLFISILVVSAFVIGSIQWRIERSRSVLEQWKSKMDSRFSTASIGIFSEVHFLGRQAEDKQSIM